MKILLINNQFAIGGAARVAAIMCNVFVERGYELYVVTDFKNIEIKYKLPENVFLLPLDLVNNKNKIYKAFKSILDINKYIKSVNPDVIIAIQADMFLRAIFANFFRKPLIVADHTSVGRKIGTIIDFTRNFLYKYSDGISILTEKDKMKLGKKFPQKKVIYNPLTFSPLNYKPIRIKRILCAGRLDVWKLKGFDIIIDIWKHIEKKYPDWILSIAGSGNDKSVIELKEYINGKGLLSRIELLGQIDNMRELYSESKIFALPSRVEGFPMVLLEAMSQGCACISFSLDGAVNEMLTKNSGIIIDDLDVISFEKSLCLLMDNQELIDSYSINGIKRAEAFTIDKFGDAWESLIYDVINK